MSPLAQKLMQDAGASQASDSAIAPPQTLAQQLSNDVNAPTPPPPPQAPWYERAANEGVRQLGLTARAGITGITGLPALVGDGLNTAVNYGIRGVNSLTDSKIPQLQMPSQMIQNAENAVGLPQPKNALERIVQDVSSAVAGTGGTYGLGKLIAASASPVIQSIGRTLTSLPGNQLVSAGAAGAAGGAAHELGLGPGWQIGASLLGGVGGSLTAGMAGSVIKNAKNVFSPEFGNPALAAPAVDTVAQTSGLPPTSDYAKTLAAKTASNISNNTNVDPHAAARLSDFQALGMSPTLGQVTREPSLFAQEQNWRGTEPGRPLLQKFNSQNQQLANALKSTANTGSTEYADSNTIMGALRNFDDSLNTQIRSAYKTAKNSTGADLNVPMQGMAQDYAQTLHDFGGKVPDGVRNNFESYGLGPNGKGTQTKVFTIEDAENLLKVINQNQSADPATNTALGKLGQSVKAAVASADDQGGVYADARRMAAQRFDLLDSVPAYKAAVRNTIAPDSFSSKYIINGNADEVAGLSNILKGADPKALKALQGQVGNKLQLSAFGQNMAGDKVFSPERYAHALNQQIGPDVLKSIYSPDQMNDLSTIGRVGAYINSEPAFSPVNRSNTGSAIIDMLSSAPLVGKAINSVTKNSMIAKALKGDISGTGLIVKPDQGAQMGTNALINGLRIQPTP